MLRIKTALPVSLLLALSLLLAACGSSSPEGAGTPDDLSQTAETPPTSEQETTSAASTASSSTGGFEAVYAEVEGLDSEARKQRLIELAQDNGGDVNVYSTMNGDEGPESIALFEEQTGLNAEFYRASASDVLNRVLEERDAGYEDGADVVNANGPQMVVMEREGVLAPLNTVAAGDLPEGAVTEYMAWAFVNVFTPMWNTEAIPEARSPQTWSDVVQDYPGQLVFEAGDWEWFAAVVPILMEEQGISEEEAIAMVGDSIRNAAAVVDGHTAMAQFVAAGQYDIASSSYHSPVIGLQNEGAPVAWEPPVDPLILIPNTAGVVADAPNPAGAVLFLDFFLTEAQGVMAKHGRQPANLATEGGTLPSEYNFVPLDLEQIVDQRDKWESTYVNLLQQSGLPVQEG